MIDEKWQKVREVFDSALRRKPEERRNFIHQACGEDKTLLAEVESLLSSLDSAESFMEAPAVAEVAGMIEAKTKRLERGQNLVHYEIIEQIGEGGMGEVYLAKDTRLNRQVALKLLAAHISEDKKGVSRFRQEALTTSALNHPNIVTIHEIGEWQGRDYIATEFVDGITLRSLLGKKKTSVSEALDLALQIASALSAAHGAGIIHRDVKPENIMIRRDGLVKILDFGIAKYMPLGNGRRALVETEVGEVIGTAAYMSPEQARGLAIDRRTDIWSLGVILYEMIAGKLPFPGKTRSDRLAAILEHDPVPLTKIRRKVPPELEQIMDRALAKNKQERYAEAANLAIDLRRLRETMDDKHSSPFVLPERKSAAPRRAYLYAASILGVLLIVGIGFGYYFWSAGKTSLSVTEKKTIAVLPLKPINTANRDEIYEVGIADSLITKLSSMKGFVVRPLSATRKYTDMGQDPLEAGRDQQVNYVLASNYQLAGGKIRVTAQLFNVASGLIEETYKIEKDAVDVFAMQDAIAGEIGNILSARFTTTSSRPTAKRGTTNEEAYRLCLQGMYLVDQRGLTNARKAVELLAQAVRLDPNYAQAWAGKAHAHRLMINSTPSGDLDDYQQSMEAIHKALALDENLADAYSALCENKMYYEYDFDAAEQASKRAIELAPNSSLAHQVYSRYLVTRGRIDEGIAEAKTAIDLEPTSRFNQRWYGNCLQYARRNAEAVAQLKRVVAMDESFITAYVFLWQALEMQGNYDEAFEWFMKSLTLPSTITQGKADEETVQSYRAAFQTSGWQGVLREQVKRFDADKQYYFFGAATNAQLGNKDKAFEYLEKSYQRRELWFAYLQVEPRFDSLRDDPRFNQLVKRIAIP
jgi:serine/threonine-protein kinase